MAKKSSLKIFLPHKCCTRMAPSLFSLFALRAKRRCEWDGAEAINAHCHGSLPLTRESTSEMIAKRKPSNAFLPYLVRCIWASPMDSLAFHLCSITFICRLQVGNQSDTNRPFRLLLTEAYYTLIIMILVDSVFHLIMDDFCMILTVG